MSVSKNRDVVTGNHALSYGALAARVQVIAAYPITPQTQIVELLSELCADGSLQAEFIKVESEHSAMAACIGASATGVRAFTATSSHGLALMHEMLHWATGSRLPIVMGNVCRAFAPPWNIWNEHTDSLAQRDTGWMQIYCASNQEVIDSVIHAYYTAEKVHLPCMINLDGFILSHTAELTDLPQPEDVDAILPPYTPSYRLDTADPCTFGALGTSEHYFELRYKIQEAMEQALGVFEEAHDRFAEKFNRAYELIEGYQNDDAELLIVTTGTLASNARVAVDRLREEGIAAGLLRIRVFRPFPHKLLRTLTANCSTLCVVDRNISFGAGGIFAQEIRSALFDAGNKPALKGYVTGLGGREITIGDIVAMAKDSLDIEQTPDLINWKGLKRASITSR